MLLGIYLRLCAGEQRPHGPSVQWDRQREETRRGMKPVDGKLTSRDSDPGRGLGGRVLRRRKQWGLLRGWWRRPWGPRDTLGHLHQAGGLKKLNWCFWTVVLEKTLESPLDCKEIQPVHPEGNQSWVFTGRTDAEAETPILWPSHAKSWLIGKDPDAGRDWGQEEKGMTEDEMAGWHHRLIGANPGRQRRIGKPGVLQSLRLKSWIRLSDWTTWANWSGWRHVRTVMWPHWDALQSPLSCSVEKGPGVTGQGTEARPRKGNPIAFSSLRFPSVTQQKIVSNPFSLSHAFPLTLFSSYSLKWFCFLCSEQHWICSLPFSKTFSTERKYVWVFSKDKKESECKIIQVMHISKQENCCRTHMCLYIKGILADDLEGRFVLYTLETITCPISQIIHNS